MATRASINLDGRIKTLTGLSDADVAEFKISGIVTADDLSYVYFPDLLTAVSVVKRRKFDLICQYLDEYSNFLLYATLSMEQVKKVVVESRKSATTGAVSTEYVDKDTPKVYPDQLQDFTGGPIDYEEWSLGTETTIKQTVYKVFL